MRGDSASCDRNPAGTGPRTAGTDAQGGAGGSDGADIEV